MTDNTNELKTDAPKSPLFTSGVCLKEVPFLHTITAAANANGDIYELAEISSYDDIVVAIKGTHGAFTSANNNDLGFFTKDDDGAFVALDADILWDGANMTSAVSSEDDLLYKYNTSIDISQTVGALLSKTSDELPANGIFLCMTENTASSAASAVIRGRVLVASATNA
jgi:hypothetical protein